MARGAPFQRSCQTAPASAFLGQQAIPGECLLGWMNTNRVFVTLYGLAGEKTPTELLIEHAFVEIVSEGCLCDLILRFDVSLDQLSVERSSLSLETLAGKQLQAFDDRPTFEKMNDIRNILLCDAAVDDIVRIDHHVGADITEIDGSAIVHEYLGIESTADDFQPDAAEHIHGSLLIAVLGGADQYMAFGPVHFLAAFRSITIEVWSFLAEAVLYAETTARIGPLDVVEHVTDDATGSALYTAFVGKEHCAIFLGGVTGSRTAVDALLSNA